MSLARELLKLGKGETLGYAIGIVTDDSPFTVQINGDTVDIIDPPLLGGVPTIGTPVFVLRPGPAIVVIGTLGSSTPVAALGGFYGDGSDGTTTISGTTTLTRDMFYDTLTVTGTLKPNGWRLFVKNTLTIDSGGVIHNNGGDATTGTATVQGNVGAQPPDNHVLGGGGAAGNGNISPNGGPGSNGSGFSDAIGGNGGAGGASGTGNAGGTGGTVTAPNVVLGGYRFVIPALLGRMIGGTSSSTSGFQAQFQGGAGGGGGGVATTGSTSTSGAGGAGGGVLLVAAREIVNDGTISADGGAGGPGVAGTAPNTGGGGGGGGGALFLVYNTLTSGGVETAAGGAGGAATGTGVAGSSGSAGVVVHLENV